MAKTLLYIYIAATVIALVFVKAWEHTVVPEFNGMVSEVSQALDR